mmetsp:Transcript_46537/g.134060  ORF Transcript_46537/g.134060 Transcript_46537/m.134060 type:complete len:242 (+) Transcript_46537:688-1413(+)
MLQGLLRSQPRGWVLAQQLRNEVPGSLGRPNLRQRLGPHGPLHHLLEKALQADLRRIVAEGVLVRDDDVCHNADGPQVATHPVPDAVVDDLRRHEELGAELIVQPSVVLVFEPPDGGEPEVDDLAYIPPLGQLVQQAVLELQVAVRDAQVVAIRDRHQQVAEQEADLQGIVDAVVQVAEVPPDAHLGHEVQHLLVLEELMELDDVGVVEPGHGLQLQVHVLHVVRQHRALRHGLDGAGLAR